LPGIYIGKTNKELNRKLDLGTFNWNFPLESNSKQLFKRIADVQRSFRKVAPFMALKTFLMWHHFSWKENDQFIGLSFWKTSTGKLLIHKLSS